MVINASVRLQLIIQLVVVNLAFNLIASSVVRRHASIVILDIF